MIVYDCHSSTLIKLDHHWTLLVTIVRRFSYNKSFISYTHTQTALVLSLKTRGEFPESFETSVLKRIALWSSPWSRRKMTRTSTIICYHSYQSYRMRKSGPHCKTQHSFRASLSDTSAYHLTTRAIRTFLISNHLGDVLQRVKHVSKCLGYTEVMGSWYKRLMTGRR